LSDILGYIPLTQTLRTIKSGVPNPFPPELYNVPAENKKMGDKVRYTIITGERTTSKVIKYGSEAVSRALRDVGDQAARMLHLHDAFEIELTQMANLRSFDEYRQDEGMDYLRYQMKEAARRPENTRVVEVASMMRYGAIYIDGAGNLLPSSSGAVITIDSGIPATHKNQVNGNIVASWALPSSDIPGDMRRLHVYSEQETGMRISTALYGKNVPKYMLQNDFNLPLLARNQEGRDKLLYSSTLPDGFLDVETWIPVYTSFFVDQNGVLQEIWNDDLLVLLPDMSQPDDMEWWGAYEGSYPVPTKFEISPPGNDPFRNHK
jgi:hypothetical protein